MFLVCDRNVTFSPGKLKLMYCFFISALYLRPIFSHDVMKRIPNHFLSKFVTLLMLSLAESLKVLVFSRRVNHEGKDKAGEDPVAFVFWICCYSLTENCFNF